MIEKLLMDFITFLISNADKISAAIGIIIVVAILANLVDKITKRTESQSARETDIQNRLLDLHDKSTANQSKIVSLMEVHETAAKERAHAQETRDAERLTYTKTQTEAMNKIVSYLNVMDETKRSVDTIETTVIRTQGNIADMQTDIPALIDRRHTEQTEQIIALQQKIEQSFQLIESALKTLQTRLTDAIAVQDSHVEAQGVRHSTLMTEIRAMMDVLKTVNIVITNVHTLVQTLPTVSTEPALPASVNTDSSAPETKPLDAA